MPIIMGSPKERGQGLTNRNLALKGSQESSGKGETGYLAPVVPYSEFNKLRHTASFKKPTASPYSPYGKAGFRVYVSSKGSDERKLLIEDFYNSMTTLSKPSNVVHANFGSDFLKHELSKEDFEFLKELDLDLKLTFGSANTNSKPKIVDLSKVKKSKKQSFDKEVFVVTQDERGMRKGLSAKAKKSLRQTGALLIKVVTVSAVAFFVVPAIGDALGALFGAWFGVGAVNAFEGVSPMPVPLDSELPPVEASSLQKVVPLSSSTVDVYDFSNEPVEPVMAQTYDQGVAPSQGDAQSFVGAEAVATMAQASTESGWDILLKKAVWLADILLKGIVIFSGASWMFGNRTKALEHLLCAGIGYVIISHHNDIANFFASL